MTEVQPRCSVHVGVLIKVDCAPNTDNVHQVESSRVAATP